MGHANTKYEFCLAVRPAQPLTTGHHYHCISPWSRRLRDTLRDHTTRQRLYPECDVRILARSSTGWVDITTAKRERALARMLQDPSTFAVNMHLVWRYDHTGLHPLTGCYQVYWRVRVFTRDTPAGTCNRLCYETREDADASGRDLLSRWFVPTHYTVEPIPWAVVDRDSLTIACDPTIKGAGHRVSL